MFPEVHLNVNSMSAAIGILTAMITPALLLSACGTFILSTSTRLARVVDRMRLLATQVEELARGPEVEFKRQRMELWKSQIENQGLRLRLLQKALTVLYVAASLIVCASLSIGLVSAVSVSLYFIPVVLGLTGASLFLAATIFLLRETQIAVSNVYDETSLLLSIASHYVAAEQKVR
jgi:hypothetical protein